LYDKARTLYAARFGVTGQTTPWIRLKPLRRIVDAAQVSE
jgi:hypothetical protein